MTLKSVLLRTAATFAMAIVTVAWASPASAAQMTGSIPASVNASAQGRTTDLREKPYVASSADGMIVARSGFATSPINSFTWSFRGVNIKVPAGCFLNMSVQGNGLKLDRTIAGVECVGPAAIVPGMFCNWSGKYRFLDAKGKQYATETTKVRSGCGQASFNLPSAKSRTMKTGQICVDFLNNGTKRGTTCMAVFK